MANVKAAKACLKMPSKLGDKIIRAQDIQAKMIGNTYFPTGWTAGTLTQTQFNADIAALVTAEQSVKAHALGAVATRDNALITVVTDLNEIMAMVQTKANANPTNSATIIASAGYFVRGTHGKDKSIDGAFNTEITGTVLLTGEGDGPHEWQMSKDQVTVTTLPSTRGNKTTVPNLNPGDVWYFRMKRTDSKKTKYNWPLWIMLKVGVGGKNHGGTNTGNNSGTMATQ